MTKYRRKISLLLVLLLFCFCLPLNLLVANAKTIKSERVVKYATVQSLGSFYIDENHQYSGYSFEYLSKISEYNGMELQVNDFGKQTNENILETFDSIETGESDIIGMVLKNEYSINKYDIVDVPYGTRYQVLRALSTDFSINEQNVLEQENLKIGTYATAKASHKLLEQYLNSMKVKYELYFYNDEKELYNALKSEEVQVILSNNLATMEGTRIVTRYAGEPYYFAVKKGNLALKEELEKTIRDIEKTDTTFQERLFQKYFSNKDYVFFLTDSEREYVAKNPVWRAMIVNVVQPIYYFSNGKEVGVAISFLEKIAKESGVEIEYVKRDKTISLDEQIERDKIQIAIGRTTNEIMPVNDGLIMTPPFLSGDFSLVSTKTFDFEETEGKRCVVHFQTDIIYELNPSTILTVDDAQEAVVMIAKGKADFGIVSTYAIQYVINNNFFPNIKAISLPNLKNYFMFGVSASSDLEVVSILNKATMAFSDKEIPVLLNEQMVSSSREVKLDELILANPLESISIIAAFLALLLLCIIILINRKSKNDKEMIEIKEKDYRDKLLMAISNNVNTVVIIFDVSTKILEYAFENTYRVLGIKNSDLLKFPKINDYANNNDMKKIIETLSGERDERFVHCVVESVHQTKMNKQMLDISVFPFELYEKQKFIVTIDDVTEDFKIQKSLEEALNESIIAGSAKTRFLSNMSHEMRTPLSAIIGMTEIVAEQIKKSEPIEKSVENIDSSARYMLQLVNDVLDMSKISEGKMTIKNEVFDIIAMFNSVFDLHKSIASSKNLTFKSTISESLPHYVLSDQVKIKQVMVNLLSNAIKYNKIDGTINIDIQCVSDNSNSIRLKVEVSDTGIGIKNEYLDKIFSPFEREERDGDEIIKGTGLGLPIAKNIVESLGGNLSVESQFNVGSKFSVELELYVPDESEIAESLEEKSVDDYDFTDKKYLVVEDSNINALIIQRLLTMKNATVEVAMNGLEACEMFEKSKINEFSAIIMDLRMPIMDGYEATRTIRAMKRVDAKSVKIIALSADAYVENMEIAMTAGMNEYCTKPIEKEKLFKILSKIQ